MSDLTATNCGCSNNSCNSLFGGNNSCIWIILLLFFCGGNGCGCNGTSLFGGNNGCGNDNNCCEWIIWLLILSSFCGNGCGCGCGCN